MKQLGAELEIAVLKLKNTAGTFINAFANATTAARTWTMPDRDQVFAGWIDIKKLCDFRLTLTSNTPVTTSDVTGATTIYCTPFNGNSIALFDGTNWNLRQSTQMSIALGTLTNAIGYDVFCYDNAGTPTLELAAWTNATTRATALVYQDGILVKSGATTRRYLGSFYTTSTTTTEDSAANRYLFNYYNRIEKPLLKLESATDWDYAATAFRQANNNTANKVSVFKGVDEDIVQCAIYINAAQANSPAAWMKAVVAIGLDSTTTQATKSFGVLTYTYPGVVSSPHAHFAAYIGQGKHDLVWLESCYDTYSVKFYGNNLSGLIGSTKC